MVANAVSYLDDQRLVTKTLMLAKQFRLRHDVDIQRLRQYGRSWHHPLIVLLAKLNDQDTSRFAFVTGRRVGNAVTRNRCKRLMREAVRHHLTEIEAGWDCLLIARNSMASASYMDVDTAVTQLLARADLLNRKS